MEKACAAFPFVDDDDDDTASKTTGTQNELSVRCPIGSTVVTKGFELYADFVLHSVGPSDGQDRDALSRAYESALDAAASRGLQTIALCCLSTGIFGFPNEEAAEVAIGTVRKWLDASSSSSDGFRRVVFCTFDNHDKAIYAALLSHFFPTAPGSSEKKRSE